MSKATTVFLALGSNVGQRFNNLQNAVNALAKIVAVETLSPVYETAPWGILDQPEFLNACLGGQTLLAPNDLLAAIKRIERELGRTEGIRYGPRVLDVDILFYDDEIIDEGALSIPHPRISERPFVLAPLNDIAKYLIHPINGKQVREMLAETGLESVKRLDTKNFRLKRPVIFAWGVKTYLMGIINLTPDSFSGDGLYATDDWITNAVNQARQFVNEGADIIDIGGESTRPGSKPVNVEEELARTIPTIEAVKQEVDIPISVDTYRASVAEQAIRVGADWVNDVWGLRMDGEMAQLVSKVGCPVVIMHNRSKPKDVEQESQLGGRYVGVAYDNLFEDISSELQRCIDLALNAGISEDKIIIDPGIGFGKTVSQNLRLLNELNQFRSLGFPLLVGPSRKSFIGYTLNTPPDDRLEGTAAAISIAIDRGADVVRVHDVKAMSRVARMTDKIVR